MWKKLENSGMKRLVMVILVLVTIISVTIILFKYHNIRYYYDSIVVTIDRGNEFTWPGNHYDFNFDTEIDYENGHVKCQMTIFPADTIIVKDTIRIRFGENITSVSVDKFDLSGDSLCYKIRIPYRDLHSWSQYKILNSGIAIENFTLHSFDYHTCLTHSLPIFWICHNAFPEDSLHISSDDSQTQLSYSGGQYLDNMVFIQDNKRCLYNNFLIILLTSVFSVLLSKSIEWICAKD